MKYLKEIEVSEGVVFKKINTARWVVAYHNEDEEYNVHFDQKISRKFEDIILDSMLEFFNVHPELGTAYFQLYRMFLKYSLDEKLLQSIVHLMNQIYDALEIWLKSHPDVTGIKIPDGLRSSIKSEVLEPELIANLAVYSWKIKFLAMYKYNKVMQITELDKLIIRKIAKKHLIDTGLDETIMNIVKGKVIQTLQSRNEMWKYLEYSIRKAHELYISQLYNYAISFIILFMRNAHNPVGYIGDFLNKQIMYVFTDIYQTEVVYHDIEEKHVKYKSMEYQAIIDDISRIMQNSVNNFYDIKHISKFQNAFKSNTLISELIVIPILSKLIFPIDLNPRGYYNINISIFNLYLSILLMSPLFRFKYIPKLITSNTTQSTRVNYRKHSSETQVIEQISNMNLPGISILKKDDMLSTYLTEMAGYIYTNIIQDSTYEFSLIEFIQEYHTLMSTLSNPQEVERIKAILQNINYEFKKKVDPVETQHKMQRIS